METILHDIIIKEGTTEQLVRIVKSIRLSALPQELLTCTKIENSALILKAGTSKHLYGRLFDWIDGYFLGTEAEEL